MIAAITGFQRFCIGRHSSSPPAALKWVAAKLPAGSATVGSVDLFDGAALRRAIDGADLVVLGAGPYNRTAEPVMEACIEKKVPYLDLDDDEASTRAALALDDKAKAAGVPILICCGASPGYTNVMTADAARDMGERARRSAEAAAAGLDRLWLALHAHLPAAPSRRRP